MWSFPLVSLFFSLMFWRFREARLALGLLCFALALQCFSYFEGSHFFFVEKVSSLVMLGRGILFSLILLNFSDVLEGAPSDKKSRLYVNLSLMVGLVAMTLTNFWGFKETDALLSLTFVAFPALKWSKLRHQELSVIFSIIFISVVAFLSFVLTWSLKVTDVFNLAPLLWMLSFSAGLFSLLNTRKQIG